MQKKIQTKRNVCNKGRWEKQVGHALRLLSKIKYYKSKAYEKHEK